MFAVLPLFARDVEVTIEDMDLGLPLEGAVIRAWDGREYVCDKDGKALISAPDGRQAVIQAAYPGYENGRLVITAASDTYTLSLRLSGIMEGRELVVEAARPGTGETQTGRGVTVSMREIAQTGEIGIIEDVMTTIKLLPGVGYAGFFNAQPSIRGGDPQDISASLDGFYILNPYHWGGGFSIFDPRMVQSARLSHGVFSARHGHTISGLLEIISKNPSSAEIEFERSTSTSAANFNLSFPLAGKGGILFMGRTTYYDPVVWLARQLSGTFESLDEVNSIQTAPYIRNGIITGNYRFSGSLELRATGFWGMDGVGLSYENESGSGSSGMYFDYTNYQGFITAGLSWNPRNDMLLRFSTGTGYRQENVDADIQYNVFGKSFSEKDSSWYYNILKNHDINNKLKEPYDFSTKLAAADTNNIFNIQGRADYDWEIGKGFLAAAGLHEMYTHFGYTPNQQTLAEKWLSEFTKSDREDLFDDLGIGNDTPDDIFLFLEKYLRVTYPITYSPDIENSIFTTSGYGLVEYRTPDNRLGAELGLRVDHFFLLGSDFSLTSKPALNPRLTVDFNVLKNRRNLQSLDLSAGTGLFSSMNNNIFLAEKKYNIDELKPNRSLTSVLGARLEFPGGLNFNIEGYYKYIFDRTYIPVYFDLDDIDVQPQFDGEGKIWGIDLMAQKMQSRYWDGWVSYSFNWAKYRDPKGGTYQEDWYFPYYHRFHNLNLVLNIKPVPRINIYTRFGIASGVPLSRRTGDGPISYPVYVYEKDNPDNHFIEKYYWPSVRDENNRTTPSLPMDIKFSIFGKNNTGKTRYELYVAVENVLALVYNAQGNTSFNTYTGEEDRGAYSAVYEIPVPIPSFGLKYSY